jgi:hypothetical protein
VLQIRSARCAAVRAGGRLSKVSRVRWMPEQRVWAALLELVPGLTERTPVALGMRVPGAIGRARLESTGGSRTGSSN